MDEKEKLGAATHLASAKMEAVPIRTKILLMALSIVAVGLIVLTGIVYKYMDGVLEKEVMSRAVSNTESMSDSLSAWMGTMMFETQKTATEPDVQSGAADPAAINMVRWKLAKEVYSGIYENVGFGAYDGSGNVTIEDSKGARSVNVSSADWYKTVMDGKHDNYVSAPQISATTSRPYVEVVSVAKNGEGNRISMVTAAVSLDKISEKVKSLRFGDNGYSILVAGDGTYISHPDDDMVLKGNILEESDPAVQELGRLMLSGRSGVYNYTSAGGSNMTAIYYPAGNGWGLATVAYHDELFVASSTALKIMIGISVFLLLVICIGIIFAVNYITKPLQPMMKEVQLLADGDFTDRPLDVRSRDELGQLAVAMHHMRTEIASVLKKVNESTESLASSAEEMNATTEQSAQASAQVATSITRVAQSAAQQFGAVGSTSTAIDALSNDIKDITQRTASAVEKGHEAANVASEGQRMLSSTIEQIRQIEESTRESAKVVTALGERSEEIGKIVDAISSIADQTNLLSLNAAIEAARAGEAGRGFAVVADEVKKLAVSSQEEASHIAELIGMIQKDTENAVRDMQAGSAQVQEGTARIISTGEAFERIVAIVAEVSEQIESISTAVKRMTANGQTVHENMQTIDSASHETAQESETVSATTEEQTAAVQEIADASRQLASLASDLQQNVRRFRL